MRKTDRERKPDIKSIEYLDQNKIVECAKGQVFYQTPKSFEIWQEEPRLFRVISIPSNKIGWVHTY